VSSASNTQESVLPAITTAETVYGLERALEHPVDEGVQKEVSQELIPSSQPMHVLLTAPILYRPSPTLTRGPAKTRLAGIGHGAGDA
jgi:hypothetical protein